MSARTASPSTFGSRLRDDAIHAREYTLFTLLLGSPFLPRALRRVIAALAGADLASSPGPLFSLTGHPKNLVVGRGVYFNRNVTVEAVAPVRIGSDTAIGMQVLIMTSHHEIGDDGAWSRTASGRSVDIGERVWIGGRAVVLPGTVIEDDVVVAAGAVVRGRLTSHGVYAGVPARRIRELGSPGGVSASKPDGRAARMSAGAGTSAWNPAGAGTPVAVPAPAPPVSPGG
ncbi:DapH/DapD/GlmU-related protein [Curtobacterium sp. A7_M15]|uniref:acyltransferase n=1 Tax=Curtobacterium sp. A7_M15 TaxID=3065241 RepID=UPI0027377ECC|nr:DapH/DapD/GlmU-related protein [Curtobacterium sp. A7_M15]MDP4332201.1 DapH/DapD/GlmU-related protein [Curtobacterium sp. A7_M15]